MKNKTYIDFKKGVWNLTFRITIFTLHIHKSMMKRSLNPWLAKSSETKPIWKQICKLLTYKDTTLIACKLRHLQGYNRTSENWSALLFSSGYYISYCILCMPFCMHHGHMKTETSLMTTQIDGFRTSRNWTEFSKQCSNPKWGYLSYHVSCSTWVSQCSPLLLFPYLCPSYRA